MKRITILWSSLASYSVAFFRSLANHGWHVQLVFRCESPDAPYSDFDLDFCESAIESTGTDFHHLLEHVSAFEPSCILMSSWNFRGYMKIARLLRRQGVYIIASMDNQWQGTLKQRLGILAAPWFLRPSIDTFLVAGDRQAIFARLLGYQSPLYGLYAGDIDRFRTVNKCVVRKTSFLFVGRLVTQKGIQPLLEAFTRYRDETSHSWTLTVAGSGPLETRIRNTSGVDFRGFVQPKDLPELFLESAALVLPSLHEPWGVVIHEAAAAGLPVICSDRCGALTYFVRDGVNGYIVSPNTASIERAFIKFSELTHEQRHRMSDASVALARLWDPQQLAEYFTSELRLRALIS